jgi:PAS domain S-box-containing protein
MKFIHKSALLVLLMQVHIASSAQDITNKKVLALYWYGKDFPLNVDFDRGIQEALRSKHIEYHAEYFESNFFPGAGQADSFRDYLKRKYSDHTIDVVLVMSWASVNFLSKYHDDLFPDVPMVFQTVSRGLFLEEAQGMNAAGVVTDNNQAQSLGLALRLHPDTERVFVINGTIQKDKTVEAILKDRFKELESKVKFTYLTDLPLNALLAQVKSLPQRSIIFYSRQDYEEPGLSLSLTDVLSLIASEAKVPIYVSGTYLGYGVVGGYVVNAYECGNQAGQLALRIMNGAQPKGLSVVEVPSVPMFDWRQLRRWGIDENRLPPRSEIHFKEQTVFEQYKWRILGALALCILQSVFIAGLLIERRRRRLAQEALRERQQRYKLATTSGQVVVWDWDLQTSEFYADPLLKSLLGYEDHEIGHHFDHWIRLVHPDDVNLLLERLRSHIDRGTGQFEAEHRFVLKDGSVRWFVTRGSVVHNNQGVAVRMIGTGTDITRRKLAEEELQLLSTRLLDAQDQERRRIARELHDGTAQHLCTVLFNLETLASTIKVPDDLQDTVSECRTSCTQALNELRTLSYLLHPPMLDFVGLSASLRWYLEGFSRRTGIDAKLTTTPDIGRLPGKIETDLFRIVQECLANIHRHSGSRTAQIRLELRATEVVLQVEDQGHGMSLPAVNGMNERPAGVGLSGIDQRLRYLGGHMQIESNSHGTTITAVVPLAIPADRAKGTHPFRAEGV